ncbi:hypothetical protein Rhopal_005062-T1 [Rhodotorula paludigena]|uniref:Proteophosphoglycan ppg4 n=1 Tax=Rhodotorula paludigena TaxID=86838 RepID=A0AAV5GNK0_9BASI|nr:hypothetical protein Rhopal_005062-T1 [Rhodotorula paludigena]
MNRFRRKSESRRRSTKSKDEPSPVRSNSGGASADFEAGRRPSFLPEPDIRGSLILPHLERRFSLLRGEDGQLVDFETMQSHVNTQRQTGFMTASEADAMLAQYRLQSAFELGQAGLKKPAKRERIDWRTLDEDRASTNGYESLRASLMTTNDDHTRSSVGTSANNSLLSPVNTASTSFSPFLPSPAASVASAPSSPAVPAPSPPIAASMSRESSTSGSSATRYPYQFRRNPNSLFGGRTHDARDLKMMKSGSSTSIASLARSTRSGRVEGEDGEVQGETANAPGALAGEAASGVGFPPSPDPPGPAGGEGARMSEGMAAAAVASDEDEPVEPVEGQSEDLRLDLDFGPTFAATESPPPLSPSNEPPRSVAGPGDFTTDDLPSPAVSDTEPVDPFYRRMNTPSPPAPVVFEASTAGGAGQDASLQDERDVSLPTDSPTIGLSSGLPPSSSFSSGLDRVTAGEALSSGLPTSPPLESLPTAIVPGPFHAPPPITNQHDTLSSLPAAPARADSSSTERPRTAETLDAPSAEDESEIEEGASTLLHVMLGEQDVSAVERPPFDLSLGDVGVDELPEGRLQYEEMDEGLREGEEEAHPVQRRPASAIPAFLRERDSTFTLASIGSSFHEAADELQSDEDILPDNMSIPTSFASSGHAYLSATSRPHSLATATPSDASPVLDALPAHLRPTSLPLGRQASSDLHQVLEGVEESAASGDAPDSSDLILQDLLLIQEKLVQSAARRAARLGSSAGSDVLASPSSFAGSDGAASTSSPPFAESLSSPIGTTSPLRIRKKVPPLYPDAPPSTSTQSSPQRRQDPVEGTVAASDLGGALAGLGLMSLTLPDVAPPLASSSQRQSRRISTGTGRRTSMGKRTSEARRTRIEDGGAELGSGFEERDSMLYDEPDWVDIALRNLRGDASDAFEFSSLVGSPDTGGSGSWEDAEEHLREDSLAPESLRTESPRTGLAHSPAPPDDDDLAKQSSEMQDLPSTSSATLSPALGEAAPIDTESFLRVPRNMPLRDPSTTTSMLIRDVRNQATLATIALKKQNPASPPAKSLSKSRSIRKGSISSPQLVSGPVNIPAVPIEQPVDPARFRVDRSKTRSKRKDEGGKSDSIGLRFKTLLKKPRARDQVGHLNGDEVTPFRSSVEKPESRARISAVPVTPPNQSAPRFESPSSQMTQSTETASTPRQARSPAYRPGSSLATLGEANEASSTASGASGSPRPLAGPSTLAVPASPSLGSIASRKSSEYAGSFIDFYAEGGDDEDDDDEAMDPAAHAYQQFDTPQLSQGRRPSLAPSVDEQLALQQEQELTARLRPVSEFEEHPEYGNAFRGAASPMPSPLPSPLPRPGQGDEVVWQVLDDLRAKRMSALSKDSSVRFSSGESSLAIDENTAAELSPEIAGMLRHRNRQRSSAGSSMPSEWDGRYPSIYFREEQALIQLGEQGGVAPEAEGRFLVRSKEAQPAVPPLPPRFMQRSASNGI